jgi:hypothetical protein
MSILERPLSEFADRVSPERVQPDAAAFAADGIVRRG